jgi:hypothetical protein
LFPDFAKVRLSNYCVLSEQISRAAKQPKLK